MVCTNYKVSTKKKRLKNETLTTSTMVNDNHGWNAVVRLLGGSICGEKLYFGVLIGHTKIKLHAKLHLGNQKKTNKKML